MRYYVEENGEIIEVDIEARGDSLLVQINGVEMVVDLQKVAEPSLYSLVLDNRSYEVFVEEDEGHRNILIGGQLHRTKVQDEWARRLANIQRKAVVQEGDLPIKAPMPGVVLTIEVKVGDVVQPRQGLVTLGAMKMENEIKAPRGGTVKAINVHQGQTVEQGRVLLVLG